MSHTVFDNGLHRCLDLHIDFKMSDASLILPCHLFDFFSFLLGSLGGFSLSLKPNSITRIHFRQDCLRSIFPSAQGPLPCADSGPLSSQTRHFHLLALSRHFALPLHKLHSECTRVFPCLVLHLSHLLSDPFVLFFLLLSFSRLFPGISSISFIKCHLTLVFP